MVYHSFAIEWLCLYGIYTYLYGIYLCSTHPRLQHTWLPSGKLLHNYGKSPFLMGKSTISMAIFNSYFDITRGYITLHLRYRHCAKASLWPVCAVARAVEPCSIKVCTCTSRWSMQCGAPQVISWFIIPITIVISTINHSYWSYKPTERYLGGTILWRMIDHNCG